MSSQRLNGFDIGHFNEYLTKIAAEIFSGKDENNTEIHRSCFFIDA